MREKMGFGSDEMESRVVVLREETPGKWVAPPPDSRAISYLARVLIAPSASQPASTCALLLAGREVGRPEAERALRSLSTLAALARIEGVHAAEGFSVVDYRLPDGNCLRNVSNPYVPLARAVPHPIRVELPRQGVQRRPLVAQLELHYEGRQLSVAISSEQLRGYDGIQSFSLDRPGLELTRADSGVIRRITFLDGMLGGEGVTLAPWRAAPLALPPGRYALAFRSDNLGGKSIPLGEVMLE
jgi:hypothetical protein